MSASIESGPAVLGIHEHLLASIPGVLVLLDDRGVVRFASGQLEHLGGRPVDVLVGSELSGYLEPKDRPLLSGLLAASAGRSPEQLTGPVRLPYLHADGRSRLAEAWALNRLADPALAGFVVLLLIESAYDYFDQVLASAQAGASLEETLAALAAALRLPPVLGECFFVVASNDGRTINRFPLRPSVPGPPAGGPWDQAMGIESGISYTELAGLPEPTRAAAGAAGFHSVSCFPILTRGESTPSACLVVWSRELGPLAMNERTAVDRALILASLMISHSAAEERLLEAAFQDLLTGLGNRRSYFQALDARVEAGDRPAVLYIDIDGFKDVNDRLGHLAGDSALRVIARRLSSVVRPTDELARIGGDEFAILCAGDITEHQVIAIAGRVVDRLAEPLSIGDAPAVKVGASIGIVFDFPPGTTSDTLLASADEALCEAKAAGRSCWRIAQVPERQRT
ncbi:MAG TPA: GGDEF domain-containing protein [Acidimicrobiales bacterium]|nr:GGDEF domain-containing protein [Acidimicrobiales bacterium]